MKNKELQLNANQTELLAQILEQEVSYVDNAIFADSQEITDLFLIPLAMPEMPRWSAYDALKDASTKQGKKVVLTGDQERIIFFKFNYARFRVVELKKVVSETPTKENVKRLFFWYEKMQDLKSYIAACNMRLISFMMKRWTNQRLDTHDLMSDGQICLLNAINKFDASRGKFSTYLYWVVNNAFSRLNAARSKDNSVFADVDSGDVEVADEQENEELTFRLDALHQILDKNIADLNDDELAIIRLRYLDVNGKRPSVEKVSETLEIKKHKVTRDEKSALDKIRMAFNREFVHNPEKIGPKEDSNTIIECELDNQIDRRHTMEQTQNDVQTEDVAPEQTETPVESVETTEATVAETTVAEAPKVETPKFKIWVDKDGTEIERKPLGPGKPPRNSHKDADGNLICEYVEQTVVKVNGDYVTVDEEGNEISRTPRKAGKGRPAKGFKKQHDGPFAGDYLHVATEAELNPPVEEAPAETSEEAPAETSEEAPAETPAAVETQEAPAVVEAPAVEATA